jgi:putative hemolysin
MVLAIALIFILLLCLGVVSALHSAVSTIRGSAAANETVESESADEAPSVRLKTERLLIALRLAWGLIFSCILVVADSFPREGLTAALNGSLAERETAAWAARGMTTMAVAVVTILLGDVLAGAYGARHPSLVASRLTRPVSIGLKLLGPLPRFVQRVTRALTQRAESAASDPSASEEDIRHLAQEVRAAGVIEEGEREIIDRVFKLGERPVASVMTPRADVVALRLNEEPRLLLERAVASGLSRFPILGQGEEEVVGVVTLQSLASVVLEQHSCGARRLDALLDAPLQVPESVTALQLLETFREKGQRFAIIVDEYGGFAGVATLTDVLEVLVGEIRSGREESRRVVARSDGSLLVDSALDVDDLFELLGLRASHDPSSGEFHSLGGFVMSSLGHVPVEGESFESFGHRFEVVDMDGNRIDKVLVSAVAAKRAVA